MYRVVLQREDRLINKLFNTKEASADVNLLYFENLLKVLKDSYGTEIKKREIQVAIKGKPYEQQGQFITVEHKRQKKYIFFSYECPKKTRNGYIVSKIPISLRHWYDDTAKNKVFEVYLLEICEEDYLKDNYKDVNFCNYTKSTVNDYQTFAYKLCSTLGIRLLNYDRLPWDASKKTRMNHAKSNAPFSSVSDIRSMRNQLQRRNRGNKSSYILEDADTVVIYGKTFGNNGFETILIAAAVKKITEKLVYFWQIKDINTKKGINRKAHPISKKNLSLLRQNLHITVYDELKEYIENQNAQAERDARNQLEFKKNLMLKYGTDEPECYLCKCDIHDLIIASHIHRVCDINKEEGTFLERRAKAVSPDNGLWLCACHDKLFEHGSIYFNDLGELQISDNLSEKQKGYVQEITTKASPELNFSISVEHLTENMVAYLSIHRKRTLNE